MRSGRPALTSWIFEVTYIVSSCHLTLVSYQREGGEDQNGGARVAKSSGSMSWRSFEELRIELEDFRLKMQSSQIKLKCDLVIQNGQIQYESLK